MATFFHSKPLNEHGKHAQDGIHHPPVSFLELSTRLCYSVLCVSIIGLTLVVLGVAGRFIL